MLDWLRGSEAENRVDVWLKRLMAEATARRALFFTQGNLPGPCYPNTEMGDDICICPPSHMSSPSVLRSKDVNQSEDGIFRRFWFM
jgi:hypothetical protein